MRRICANFPTRHATLLLLALSGGCENQVCGDYRAFFEDPRLEVVSGNVAAGREGALFHISSKSLPLGLEVLAIDSTTTEDILAIKPTEFDGDVVLVSGRAGTVLLSHDEGLTWTRPVLPANFRADLHAVILGCPDSDSNRPGLAVGAGGSALRSIDGGLSWTEAPTGRSATFRSAAVLGPQEVVIVGDEGLIIRSADFGASWSDVSSPTSDDLIRVTAYAPPCRVPPEESATADYVFAAGRLGDLLVSRDRGETWELFAHFPAGPVVEFFPSAGPDPSAPETELLSGTVVSGRFFWDFDASGTLIRTREFPADITGVDSSAQLVVAGSALYHRHFDPGCQ